MPSFIADGYTFKAGIDPVEHVHSGMEFVYRPCTPEQTAQFVFDTEGKKKGKDLRRAQARKLMEHLVSWELPEGQEEECLELTQDVLENKIHSRLLSQMIAVVFWGDPPDYGEPYNPEEQEKN